MEKGGEEEKEGKEVRKTPRTRGQAKLDKEKMYEQMESMLSTNSPMSEEYRRKIKKIANYKPAALTYGKKNHDKEREAGENE